MTKENKSRWGTGLVVSWRLVALFLLILGTVTIRFDYSVRKDNNELLKQNIAKTDTLMMMAIIIKNDLEAQKRFREADIQEHISMKSAIAKNDGDIEFLFGYTGMKRSFQ